MLIINIVQNIKLYIKCFFNNNFIINNKNAALDGVRGLAVLLVFHVHLFAPFGSSNYYLDSKFFISLVKTIQSGHTGVDIFFILSGFFIYLSIKNNRYTFFSFLFKRYTRLLPLSAFVLVYTLLNVNSLTLVIDQLTLLNLFGKLSDLNFVQWSLAYEVYFYILVGFFLILFPKEFDRYQSIIAIIFILIVLSFFINVSFFEPVRFSEFFIGVLIGKLKQEQKLNNIRFLRYNYLPVLTFIFMIALSFSWGNDLVNFTANKSLNLIIFYISYAFFVSLLLASILERNYFSCTFFSFYPLRLLGAISFSFYMVHALIAIPFSSKVIIHFFDKYFYLSTSSFLFIFSFYILSFFSAILISLFLFYFLEKPYFIKKIK